jgi:undecaprenyl-diphosphatase
VGSAATSTRRSPQWTRRPADAVTVVVGLAVLAAGMVIVNDGSVPGWERRAFRTINDLPGSLYPVLWPFQQLGALFIGPIVALFAAVLRRYRLAVAALLVTVMKLGSERVVKDIVTRQRPGRSIGVDIHRRGDVSLHGPSFVSGHAVLAAALAGVVTPYLSRRWKIVPWIVVALVMLTRVYVGAHNPLDVVCGAALGAAIAGLANLLLGVPSSTDEQRIVSRG